MVVTSNQTRKITKEQLGKKNKGTYSDTPNNLSYVPRTIDREQGKS